MTQDPGQKPTEPGSGGQPTIGDVLRRSGDRQAVGDGSGGHRIPGAGSSGERFFNDTATTEKLPVVDLPQNAGGAADLTTQRRRRHASRSRGRVLALQWLYCFEQNRYRDDGLLLPEESAEGADDDVRAFAQALGDGLRTQMAEVDAVIDQRLENWTVKRLAVLDRSILRLGAYELLHCKDTPPRVAINEYIELAKQYGSEAKTAKLVNGVLDRIAREFRGDEVTKREERAPTPKG